MDPLPRRKSSRIEILGENDKGFNGGEASSSSSSPPSPSKRKITTALGAFSSGRERWSTSPRTIAVEKHNRPLVSPRAALVGGGMSNHHHSNNNKASKPVVAPPMPYRITRKSYVVTTAPSSSSSSSKNSNNFLYSTFKAVKPRWGASGNGKAAQPFTERHEWCIGVGSTNCRVALLISPTRSLILVDDEIQAEMSTAMWSASHKTRIPSAFQFEIVIPSSPFAQEVRLRVHQSLVERGENRIASSDAEERRRDLTEEREEEDAMDSGEEEHWNAITSSSAHGLRRRSSRSAFKKIKRASPTNLLLRSGSVNNNSNNKFFFAGNTKRGAGDRRSRYEAKLFVDDFPFHVLRRSAEDEIGSPLPDRESSSRVIEVTKL